jgi:predicted SnoaL-like aldol condensation-catalyzing enzyme
VTHLPAMRTRTRSRHLAWHASLASALAAALLTLGCTVDSTARNETGCRDTPDEHRAVVLAFYEQGLVRRDPLAAFARYMAPDFVEHKPDVASGTRDSTAAFLARLMQELPGAAWQVHRTVAEGDLVFLHASFTPAPGAPAYAIADLFRLRDCMIVEHWDAVAPPPERALNPNPRF